MCSIPKNTYKLLHDYSSQAGTAGRLIISLRLVEREGHTRVEWQC
jgi:hypothetical protein